MMLLKHTGQSFIEGIILRGEGGAAKKVSMHMHNQSKSKMF